MGAVLPKAATPIVVESHGGTLFRVGFAEMNGWRKNMEDSHVIEMKEKWGFFGVFDGHGGDQCSNFIMQRLYKELEGPEPPADDAAMKELMLRLDREFLALEQPSGSTGTFSLVTPLVDSAGNTGQYQLRVGNIGDSRVVLGRADGSIVEGPGTDAGLTTDHKPDHPDERARIERTGGNVQVIQGCARVNGDLAVSRAFGDAPHKKTGGPAQEDHPVTVEPEFLTINCSATDFLILVCDGISEGEFPNREVVKLAAEKLRDGGEKADPAAAAAAVCRKAIECGSKDNLSCMIVLFGGGEPPGPKKALLSGPFSAPTCGAFRKAYEVMAKHAGLTLAQAVEQRYDDVRKERLEKVKAESQADDVSLDSLRQELLSFADGPPSDLCCGSEERTKWFQDWLDGHTVREDPDPSSMNRQQLLALIEERPDILAMAQAQGVVPARVVQVASEEALKAEIEATPGLKWVDDHAKLCGATGMVIFDDEMDGTSRVKFQGQGVFAWLPTRALIEERRMVKVAGIDVLKPAVEAHSSLKWNAKLGEACGQLGVVVKDDVLDETSQVHFPEPLNLVAWLPTSALVDVEDEDEEDGRMVKVASIAVVKPAVEAHSALKWFPKIAEACGQIGFVVKDDESDGTSQVRFAEPVNITAWLPTSALTNIEDGDSSEEADGQKGSEADAKQGSTQDATEGHAQAEGDPESSPKRQRTE